VSDLALSGGGIIDGRGQQWWAQAESTTTGQEAAAAAAPKALHFEDCQDVAVNGLTLQNSQREHLVFTRCSNVEANYLRVTSPEHSPGTVGVLLVSSTNVHIMDDLFSVGTFLS
jgi:polygalacturonase